MSLTLASKKSFDALFLSVSPHLKLFDQPLLKSLAKFYSIAHWEYVQTEDEPSSLDPALTLLYDYVKTFDHPIHLMGHGLSGLLALLFSHHYPQRVRSLTLLAVGGQPGITWHAHYYAQRHLFPCSREQLLAKTAQSLLASSEQWRVRSLALALRQELDTSPIPHSLLGIAAFPPNSTPVPMLVCGSADDSIVDPTALKSWQNFLKPIDQIWFCPDGRHFFHYFYPKLVALKVLDFWEKWERSSAQIQATIQDKLAK